MATIIDLEAIPVNVTPTSSQPNIEKSKEAHVSVGPASPPLGVTLSQKKWWWQRGAEYDSNAIATLASFRNT